MVLSPETSPRETARLAALHRTGLRDSPHEQLFDLIPDLAAKAIHVPVVNPRDRKSILCAVASRTGCI